MRIEISVISVGVDYQLIKYVGVGLKYPLFRLAVDLDDDKWHGRVELDYEGPFIYLSANWK